MDTIPYNPSWPANSKSAARVLPLAMEDVAYLHARRKKLGSGMKLTAGAFVVIILYRLVSSDSDPMLGIGFGILAVLGVALFWYLFARRIDKTLAEGTKHVGLARIARKVIAPSHDIGPTTRTFILDWDFKDKLSEVYPSDEMFDRVTEGELVEIHVATANKLVLAIRESSSVF